MAHTIELRKVSKYYAGKDSVSMGISRVDLELDIGEFVAITGESGSGKSTLLNVISGLDTYEEGEMFVCGEDTTAFGTDEYENYRKTYIGNIFQDYNLINSYTVYQNIEAVMLITGKTRKECRGQIMELIKQVGLSAYRNTKVSKLSGGQKQRVAIARALAKNAPIIVADEPTGNLDSASAEAVMETLSKVSKDKLVIIVTHNYEQAEPYVTRKITMHDGKIIEDKRVIRPESEDKLTVDQLYDRLKVKAESSSNRPEIIPPGKMKKSSELRLGLRNTFNLPAKFILLFIVYFFVSSAVLGQYAATKNSMHENSMLGTNTYFANTSPERLILKKADGSSFTENDFDAVRNTPNIDFINKNDIAIDAGVRINMGDFYAEGPVVSYDQLDKDDITYGHMPQNDYEIVIRVDSATDAFIRVADSGNDLVGMHVSLTDMNQTKEYRFEKDVSIAGIVLNKDLDENSDYSLFGRSTIYVSDAVSKDLHISMMADASTAELNFAGTKVRNESGHAVYASPEVPDGEVYIFASQLYYYDDEDVTGEDFSLKIKNRFYESEGNFKVGEVITDNNCWRLVGIPVDDYESYFNCVFISENDFRTLFDKGYYQISAFMANEQESETTQQALNQKGYTTMALKESLTDATGGYNGVVELMSYGRLALEFIVLFIIAYLVIRLIMRSRSSYYSTLRILGASKKNTANILKVELISMMLIAYGIDLLFVLLVNKGVLQKITGYNMEAVSRLLFYLTPVDYAVLGVLLLLMSLLLAGRYSRHIFKKSAMKTIREGV